MKTLPITIRDGSSRLIYINHIPALTAYAFSNQLVEYFCRTLDQKAVKSTILEVLSHASVEISGEQVPLKTEALIDNHLQTVESIDAVFKSVLEYNGLDKMIEHEKSTYWEKAGSEMAVAFTANIKNLLSMVEEIQSAEKESA